ncbi:MAG: hypothetical protein J6S73_01305 [Lentisphaeria bacterium]|nr:hypothetical protein [Lentisphaeria bacterium]
MMSDNAALAMTRIIFKDCELGVTNGLPIFRIMPEKISADENGVCRIVSARQVTVVFGLEHLEEGFAVLLDSHGRLQQLSPELFRKTGTLRLIPLDNEEHICWEFHHAQLAGDTGYGIIPDAGHRLLLEFQLSPAGTDGAYMQQRTLPEA